MAPSIARLPVGPSELSGMRPIAPVYGKPVLASECLKDDIAPLEPFALATRIAFATSGASLFAAAVILSRVSFLLALAIGVGGLVTAFATMVPAYRVRGVVAAAGSFVALMGAIGLHAMWIPAALSIVVLAPALFLRATYRAHRGTRIALGVGIALFVIAAALGYRGSPLSTATTAVMLAVASASLLGFMGEQSTGGCAFWAPLAIVASAASLLTLPITIASAALVAAVIAAATAASVAVFQIAAIAIAPVERAREHRPSTPPPPPVNDV
jgi:hypothetical protein